MWLLDYGHEISGIIERNVNSLTINRTNDCNEDDTLKLFSHRVEIGKECRPMLEYELCTFKVAVFTNFRLTAGNVINEPRHFPVDLTWRLKFLPNLSVCFVKAKFHYASWSQTGSKLVADLQLVLDDRRNFCSLQVCDQLRTCLRPDSVMEFGFEPVCDQVRAGSSYLDMSRWLEPGRRQVRSWSQTCSEQKFGLSSSTSRRSATSFEPVCDQIA